MCSSLSHLDKSDPRSFHSESPPFKYWPGGGVDERLIEAAAASVNKSTQLDQGPLKMAVLVFLVYFVEIHAIDFEKGRHSVFA